MAGATDTLGQAINTAMGGNLKLRDVAYIDPTDWAQAIAGMEIPVSGSAARKLLPLEKGHLIMVRRVARLRLGLTALPLEVVVGAFVAAAAPNAPESANTTVVPTADPALKLSAVWGPTLRDSSVDSRLPQPHCVLVHRSMTPLSSSWTAMTMSGFDWALAFQIPG